MSEVGEQVLHQGEVPEVVDAERHLHSVGGALGAGHHLKTGIADDRVQRRQSAAAEVVGEGADRRQ